MKKVLILIISFLFFMIMFVGCGSVDYKSVNGGFKLLDIIIMVWYLNEFVGDLVEVCDEIGKVIEKVIGKKVEYKFIIDYFVVVELIVNGIVGIVYMGFEGYI